MKLISKLLTFTVFVAVVFAVWWVFVLPTPLNADASKQAAADYVRFKPIHLKAIHVDDISHESMIQVIKPYADKNNVIAQYELGHVYYDLPSPPQEENFRMAIKYFRQAAEAGWPAAQNSYGAMLMQGEGVPKDLIESYKWFSIASQAGHSKAQGNLALVSGQMSVDQVYKGEELSSQWIADFVKDPQAIAE